jgi:hypothetical protein
VISGMDGWATPSSSSAATHSNATVYGDCLPPTCGNRREIAIAAQNGRRLGLQISYNLYHAISRGMAMNVPLSDVNDSRPRVC